MPLQRFIKWFAWILCILVGIILCLKNLREPDIWWMLTTGDWMLENSKVIKEDVFSFTFAGTPWINVKWAFEILISLLNRLGGPEFLMTLQALVVT
ncbi:MAG: cytochrome C biosynthesis protein, partial [Bacteroidetes bacterium]|nr:cytochrome C biosynthesis protein [Bacteroidota bacterium]